MEKLVCDRCGIEYTDEGSINAAKLMKDDWVELCHKESIEPRGIAPCPILHCKGELILQEIREEEIAKGR